MISVMFGMLMFGAMEEGEEKEADKKPAYHIQVLIQNTDEYFWTLFQEGAKVAGEESGVYIEFVKNSQRDTSFLRETVEKGVNAGVDGIVLQAADVEETGKVIEEAREQGVEIVTYENDNFNIPGVPVIGSNNFSTGRLAGKMAVEAANANANVVLIMNDTGEQEDTPYKNLLVQGIMESLSEYGSMNVTGVYTLNYKSFEAEKIVSRIISDKIDMDMIICFDEKSTPGVAQFLVDNNMVGDVKLIGYGVLPHTLDYIQRQVIYGTVCPDAYEIGYYSVKQMAKSLEGQQISDYTSSKLYVIDKNNVSKYQQEVN